MWLAAQHLDAVALDQQVDHERAAGLPLAAQAVAAVHEEGLGRQPVADLPTRATTFHDGESSASPVAAAAARSPRLRIANVLDSVYAAVAGDAGMKGSLETHYARSGDVHIAYQTVDDADLDLVLLPGAFSHVEHQWEEPSFARFLHRLASFSRLIVLDVRGTGLSDRAADLPTLEEQIDDVLAVLDAVGSKRAALFGLSQGGGLATLCAAAHPARTSALVLFGAYARSMWADDFPWGWTPEDYDELMRLAHEGWGSGVSSHAWRLPWRTTRHSKSGGRSRNDSREARERFALSFAHSGKRMSDTCCRRSRRRRS